MGRFLSVAVEAKQKKRFLSAQLMADLEELG